MKQLIFRSALLVLIAVGTAAAFGFARSNAAREDCPGTVACPLTGEEVCKDRCPLLTAQRSDCPGKIACPITGEPACADECPLEAAQATDAGLPPCCRQKQ
uniref:4Fe-4S ferredoxin-type domain-containing protein n=1 Tax=Schlesneria paludicola TaxID=360056 RepID=A0A7C2K0I4_9PLAN